MLLLKKSQNHIFIFKGLRFQIQHLFESARTHARACARTHTQHTHTDIHIILQQDDVWAKDGVYMKEGI